MDLEIMNKAVHFTRVENKPERWFNNKFSIEERMKYCSFVFFILLSFEHTEKEHFATNNLGKLFA
jgi:hypothetical protein